MRAELVAELDTARYTNKPLPGTGFESRGGEVRLREESVESCGSARQTLYFLHCGRNRPDDTPNVHLLGFSFMRYWQSRLNASARAAPLLRLCLWLLRFHDLPPRPRHTQHKPDQEPPQPPPLPKLFCISAAVRFESIGNFA
ncbi:hypothetical protein L3X38_012433 [Prunus dulcis]|uniref:Uncharacterized protein n=1 Tax=Prunus dulcis TaxID=3755 RepID=A0AAD4ZGD5_PRUDU|nr:hypothetical protein L3X38_012433 [Prunus dulcis]